MNPLHALSALLALALLCLVPDPLSGARAGERDVEWMALMLEGQKTGWLRTIRSVRGDEVHHEETVHIAIQRTGVPIELSMIDRSVETADGRPLSFSSRQDIAGGSMLIEGEVGEDGTTTVRTTSGGSVQTRTFPWPEGALLAEGLRLAMVRAGLEPGTRFEVSAFIPSSLQAAPVDVTVTGRERVDLFGVEMTLTRTEQVMALGRTSTRSVTWLDADLRPKKMRFPVMGMTLETVACPEECATAMAQPAEFFTQAFVRSPEPLDAGRRASPLRYTVRRLRDEPIHFPSGSEQTTTRLDDETLALVVRPAAGAPAAADENPDAAGHLGQTRWLQTQAPEILALVAEAGGAGDAPRETMARFEAFVRRFVSDKSLSVGYATALETARSRSGDCTEHALLLAALGRAAGIPTRIATGLAYVDGWIGARDVFVPHAWTQALIDGHWVSFDAALGGFDSGHLALDYGDGDPWSFYDGVNTLGNFEILAVEPAAP